MTVTINNPYPSLLRRLAAIGYDGLLLIAVSIAYGLVYIGIQKLLLGTTEDKASGLLFQIGWGLTWFSFFGYFWRRGGQTTGMRAWRIQLFNRDQQPPSMGQCAIRFLLAPIGWLLWMTACFHPRRHCLHDEWSGTYLVLLDKHNT